jgi:hypothetical protein
VSLSLSLSPSSLLSAFIVHKEFAALQCEAISSFIIHIVLCKVQSNNRKDENSNVYLLNGFKAKEDHIGSTTPTKTRTNTPI